MVTLLGASLTPLLLLFDWPKDAPPGKFWQALPSAVGGVAAALNAALHFRQQWAQNYATLSSLMNEHQRFRCRTSPDYNKPDDDAVDAFQNRISDITMAEVTAWKTGLLAEDMKKRDRL